MLRSEALEALGRCTQIIHAGDVGAPDILTRLRAIAPVTAVRGNIDRAAWAQDLAITEVVCVGQASLYVLHDVNELDLDPVAANLAAVVSGHSHQPSVRHERGVLYLNPGSAGPRRFRLPVSLAILEISTAGLQPHLVTLL